MIGSLNTGHKRCDEANTMFLTKLQAWETKEEGKSHVFGNPLHYLSTLAQLVDSSTEFGHMSTVVPWMRKHFTHTTGIPLHWAGLCDLHGEPHLLDCSSRESVSKTQQITSNYCSNMCFVSVHANTVDGWKCHTETMSSHCTGK